MSNADYLIEQVMNGVDPGQAINEFEDELVVADMLALEYFNPHLQEWQTIDEIDPDFLGEMQEWDSRESSLDEETFVEKATKIQLAWNTIKENVQGVELPDVEAQEFLDRLQGDEYEEDDDEYDEDYDEDDDDDDYYE